MSAAMHPSVVPRAGSASPHAENRTTDTQGATS